MARTAIEWSEMSWNPTTGCSKVSPGCAHCYAERIEYRFGRTTKPWTPENAAENVVLHPDRLDQPLCWRKPRMVFVNSMSDLFHEQVRDEFIARVFAVMGSASHHTFQVLTKRPERMRDFLAGPNFALAVMDAADALEIELPWTPPHPDDLEVFPNVWLGASIENRRFVHRADTLRETPAAVRFISAEPLLGPLAKQPGCPRSIWDGPYKLRCGLGGDGNVCARHGSFVKETALDLTDIDWLIAGAESGPGARPMREEWVRDLRDAALATGTAFFYKQDAVNGRKLPLPELDGRQWVEFPETTARTS